MTSPNGKAALNDPTPATNEMQTRFDPAAVTAFWMSSSARMMRSSAILMQGMTEVARLEATLGQQCLQRSMSALHGSVHGAKPDQMARMEVDEAMQNVDSLITTMRKISDQFRHTLWGSTHALFDNAAAVSEPSFAASIHVDDPVVKRKSAPAAAEQAITG